MVKLEKGRILAAAFLLCAVGLPLVMGCLHQKVLSAREGVIDRLIGGEEITLAEYESINFGRGEFAYFARRWADEHKLSVDERKRFLKNLDGTVVIKLKSQDY